MAHKYFKKYIYMLENSRKEDFEKSYYVSNYFTLQNY